MRTDSLIWDSLSVPVATPGTRNPISPREIIPGLSNCAKCGTRFEEGHRFCPHCGTPRDEVGADAESKPADFKQPAPPPSRPLSGRGGGVAPAVASKVPDQVTVMAVLSAATAVALLVLLAQTAAVIFNPHGRDSINLSLAQGGVLASQRPGLLVLTEIFAILILLIPALLHGLAFYGLMALRRGGWVLAFLLSIAWCLVLVGLPFAYLLWRRDTREAFGFIS